MLYVESEAAKSAKTTLTADTKRLCQTVWFGLIYDAGLSDAIELFHFN